MEELFKTKNSKRFHTVAIVLSILLGILVIIYYVFSATQNKSKTINIPLSPTPTFTPNQLIEDQSKSDIEVGVKMNEVLEQAPWINALPLQTSQYFVYYDTNDKKFHGTIYAPQSDFNTIEAKIKKELTDLGVNIDSFQFGWDIQPPGSR